MSDLAQVAPIGAPLPDAAKSPDGACELPTGFIDADGVLHKDAIIREMTGEEEDILTSRRLPAHTKMQKVLENCTVSIGTVSALGNQNWSHVTKGLVATDRLQLIIAIRMATLGNVFQFKTKCPTEGCGHLQDKAVDLAEFKINGMPAPDKRAWTGKLPKSGWSYSARAQTGVEEEKLAKAATQTQDTLSLGILVRLTELDGKMPVTLDMVKRLPFADRIHLREAFKNHEGAIDNEVEMTCDECQRDFKAAIDIGDRSFFFPSET